MSSVVETSVNRTLQFQSGPPRLAEQEHRDMLRSLAVVLTALCSPDLLLTVSHSGIAALEGS